MKIKYLVLVSFLFVLCGCTSLQKENVEDIVGTLATGYDKANIYRTGYSYYLSQGLTVTDYSLCNETIESNDNTFYLYVDLISYYNKKEIKHEKSDNSKYYSEISMNGKNGYFEINLKENNKYLIEIMFNYAKIEVMVDETNINVALKYAISILKSIEYNDNIIKNLLEEDVLNYQEEVYDIFGNTGTSSYLTALEQDQYVEPDEEVKDSDYIK